MNFASVFKTRHKSVSRENDKITRNKIIEFFSREYLTIRQNVDREEISCQITHEVLRKRNVCHIIELFL